MDQNNEEMKRWELGMLAKNFLRSLSKIQKTVQNVSNWSLIVVIETTRQRKQNQAGKTPPAWELIFKRQKGETYCHDHLVKQLRPSLRTFSGCDRT